MKYRIVEKSDLSGEICFFPQYKKLFFWFNFMEMELFPKVIKFYSLESATKFIKKQLNNPEKKIYYVGND
jgi:hypothetical protein